MTVKEILKECLGAEEVTLKEILKEWLEKEGYDGLCYLYAECGCGLDDLMPCDEPNPNCLAGHCEEAPPESGVDYFVFSGKKGNGDGKD